MPSQKDTAKKAFRLALHNEGNPTGVPIVLLHGQISTHRYMQQVSAKLAPFYDIYAPDLLGFGDSPKPKNGAYTPSQHAASVHKTLQHAGVSKPFILFGHSMGAQVALRYAALYPKQVKAIVLTGLPLFESPTSAYDQLAHITTGKKWVLKGKRARAIRVVAKLAKKPSTAYMGLVFKDRYPDYVVADILKHTWQSFHKSMENTVIAYNPLVDIAQSKHNIHLVFATNDPLNKNPQQKLAGVLSAGTTVTLVEGSHHIPLEHPDYIAETILSL